MTVALPADSAPAEELERYRRELLGYCYRMLGSSHEAEDAVQDTMLRAWRALPGLEDRAGLRPWLYRIATNVCLDLLKGRSRRALPMDVAPVSTGAARPGRPTPATRWVEPAPDRWMLAAEADPTDADPAERVVAHESVRLAFVAALQHLAPRQRAVLILRDVLRWHAAEVAALLETSADAVNSALRRARAALEGVDRDAGHPPAPDDGELLAAYVSAFEDHDVERLVGLLREDAVLQMPPLELWVRGRDEVRRFLVGVAACRDEEAVPVAANGSPAVAVYRPAEAGGPPVPFALHVLDAVGGGIRVMHVFLDPTLFGVFGLPVSPGGSPGTGPDDRAERPG